MATSVSENGDRSMETPALAVSWEVHQRTRSLCKEFGLPLFEVAAARRGLGRYIVAICQTAWLLARKRPRVLVVQNPSLILALMGVAYSRLRPSAKLVVDCHNVAIEQLESRRGAVRHAARLVCRASVAVIVTNKGLESRVASYGGAPLILPDPLPTSPIIERARVRAGRAVVTVIATYAADEPIEQIIEAAHLLREEADFFFTGNSAKWRSVFESAIPENVRFTGFLSTECYWEQLYESDALVDLTTREDCLVCGAYEALAVGRPVVLTDTAVNRRTFANGAFFARNESRDIAEVVRRAVSEVERVYRDADATRQSYTALWGEMARPVRLVLAGR